MQIKNGIVSNLFDDAQIEDINSHFNGKYPGIDAEISVNLNRKNYDDESCQELVLRYVFRYKHPLSPKEKTWFFLEQEDGHHDVYKGIESTLEKHSVQTKTCNHYFIRPKDEFGSEYPDGRGRCVKCELELKDILEPIPNISIIKMSMSSNGVVAKFDWGKTFVQGGDSGIVFSRRKSYTTAFVEAFPKINGMGTFIRGEGEDVKSAEDACWEKYQRMLNVTIMNGIAMLTERFVMMATRNVKNVKWQLATLFCRQQRVSFAKRLRAKRLAMDIFVTLIISKKVKMKI
jgi:hypothetical protein